MLFSSRMLTPEEDKSTNLQVLEWLNCYIGKTGVLGKSRNLVVWHACSCELLEKERRLRFKSDFSFRFEFDMKNGFDTCYVWQVNVETVETQYC